MMQLTSVNLGRQRTLENGKKTEETGIFKLPTQGEIEVTSFGLAGDCVKNQKSHGGVDQAIYIYGGADYAWWSAQLGYPLEAGTFGENWIVSDLETATLHVGDRLRVGTALVEVTAPRIPCSTLAARMNDPQFVKKFHAAERPGVYCRVIETGHVAVGDLVTLMPYTAETISIRELYRGWYEPPTDALGLQHFLASPMAIRARQRFEMALTELRGNG